MKTLLAATALALAAFMAAAPTAALALDAADVRALVDEDTDVRVAAIARAVSAGDAQAAAFLQALADGEVQVGASGVVVVARDGRATDPLTGTAVTAPAEAEDVVVNNRLRREIGSALAALRLKSPDRSVRLAAVQALQKEADAERLPVVEAALAAEADAQVRARLEQLRDALMLAAPERQQRLAAAQALAASSSPEVKALILERLRREGAAWVEPDPEVRGKLELTLRAIDERLAWGERLGAVFTGISLGSILLLAALGLAITYGLMGVINMAHGELIMIGAYATWLVQNAFRAWFPGAFDWYMAAAVPVSFLAAALVGVALERSVIRWLYGRPLETLLATWGISLVLMQAVRMAFGAQNVQVENPAWLSGGLAVASNVVLPYNRIAIVAFAALVLAGVALVLARTRLGLHVRGVTQNRTMAACVGVPTARVDTMAFGLGSGIAGLAGCALSQVGNVGPDLGQSYIVDSFLVVVLGGVGQLAGTVYAALGLGIFNKFLEGIAGAVLAKIAVLVLVIVFIQKRPQGLFALKGRSAEG